MTAVAEAGNKGADWIGDHKAQVGIGVGLAGIMALYVFVRRHTAANVVQPQSPAQYLTPNVLAATPAGSGEVITVTGPTNRTPAPVIAPPPPVPMPAPQLPPPPQDLYAVPPPPPPSSNTSPYMVPSNLGPPTNQYSLGQVVAPGETVVSQVFSPIYGWLNETSKGGIYTGGGGSADIGQLPYGGSFLGYAGTTADPGAEVAAHGSFGPGSLSLLPTGYEEVNLSGETYDFAA